MIKFYYSGASTFEAPQQKASLSLGGYVSSTPIPNGENNSVFSELSLLAAKNKYRETKLIVLKNELNSLNNVILWSNYNLAIVEPIVNEKNEILFEQISNSFAIPYYATFNTYTTENPAILGNLAINKYLGIWVSRKATSEIMEPLNIYITHD